MYNCNSKEDLAKRGIDYDALVGFLANEYDEGCIQGLFTSEQIDDGAHYFEARQIIANEVDIELIISAFEKGNN